MATRASVCSAKLKRFRSKDDFLLRLVTVDETWVHYYEPENKAPSRHRVGSGSPRPKKFKTQPFAGKVMPTVFWEKGVIILDFLSKRCTITGVYYANLLDQLRTAIREKRRGKLSKGVLLQQDNARVHTCKVAMHAVERNGYELIPHPAYSPDLAPSYSQTWKRISVDFISGLMKKSWRQLRSGSMERTLTFSVLGWWHLNTVGLSASH